MRPGSYYQPILWTEPDLRNWGNPQWCKSPRNVPRCVTFGAAASREKLLAALRFVISLALQNIWPLPGNSQRTSVNQLQVEISVSSDLPHGWYLLTAPTFSRDWTQSSRDRRLIPFEGGLGRALQTAKKAVDWNIALYSNVICPIGRFTPKWQISLQCTSLHARGPK
jgi:hypothetical protein